MSAKAVSSIALPPELWRAIDDLADAQDTSRSKLIERWVRDAVDQEKTTLAVFSNPVLLKSFSQLFGDRSVLKAMAQAMGEKVSDEQLELFQRGLQAVGDEAQKAKFTWIGKEKPKGKGKGKGKK